MRGWLSTIICERAGLRPHYSSTRTYAESARTNCATSTVSVLCAVPLTRKMRWSMFRFKASSAVKKVRFGYSQPRSSMTVVPRRAQMTLAAKGYWLASGGFAASSTA